MEQAKALFDGIAVLFGVSKQLIETCDYRTNPLQQIVVKRRRCAVQILNNLIKGSQLGQFQLVDHGAYFLA